MVTTGIKEAIENPAGLAGGMVGITGVAGGLAKAAKVGVRGARKGAGKLMGKGKRETSALNVLKEEKGNPKVKVETQKSGEGKRSPQPSTRAAHEDKGGIRKRNSEKGGKKEDTKNDRREGGRRKREEERRKPKREKPKKNRGRKPKKVRRPHRRIKKIVKGAKFPHDGSSSAKKSLGKTAGRNAKKSYRRKEIINQFPWL